MIIVYNIRFRGHDNLPWLMWKNENWHRMSTKSYATCFSTREIALNVIEKYKLIGQVIIVCTSTSEEEA